MNEDNFLVEGGGGEFDTMYLDDVEDDQHLGVAHENNQNTPSTLDYGDMNTKERPEDDDEEALPSNLRVTHRSLFDNTVQGLARTDAPAFCFQGHPEASPGPRDIGYLFDRFTALMEKK